MTKTLRALIALVSLLLAALTLGVEPAHAQSFSNGRVADLGLQEVGTRRATGWNMPGECIKSAQRWVANAGGYFGPGGVISGYRNSGAVQIPLADAQRGDVLQYTNGNDSDWTHAHTVVVVNNLGGGRYSIVQSNAPGYVGTTWRTDASGLVTTHPNWKPTPASGWYTMAWRFGNAQTTSPSPSTPIPQP